MRAEREAKDLGAKATNQVKKRNQRKTSKASDSWSRMQDPISKGSHIFYGLHKQHPDPARPVLARMRLVREIIWIKAFSN
jgi:hypothetical protein